MSEETNLRESLEAAVAQFEEQATEDIRDAQDKPAEAQEAPPQDAAPTEDVPETPEEPAADAFLSDEGYPDDAERYPRLTKERVNRAPEGWRPAAREGWSELPESVRREIHRREADIAFGMQEATEARHFSERFNTLVAPYRPLMAAEGAEDPLQAIDKLMQTVAVLAQGNPQQRAARMAQLIQGYGVDVQLLDDVLAAQVRGEAPPEAGSRPDSALDARLRPIEDFVQSMSGQLQNVQQRRSEAVQAEIANFRENAEFYEDVRLEMADLMELADRRGRPMTLQQAYDTACNLNPSIQAVLSRRQAENAEMEATNRVNTKLQAASASLPAGQTPAPGANGAVRPVGSIREALMSSIDALEN